MSSIIDKEAAGVDEASGLQKAEAMMHPVRLRLMMALAGREMTTQQLADMLPDVAKASLYRHMARLNEVGVVRVVRETPIRGTLEKVYVLHMESARLNPHDLANVSAEEQARYFSAFIASLLAQFQSFAQQAQESDLIAQGLAYSTAPFYLTDAEYTQAVEELRAVLRPRMENRPDGQRRRRLISLVVLPDNEAEPAETHHDDTTEP